MTVGVKPMTPESNHGIDDTERYDDDNFININDAGGKWMRAA